MCRVGNAACNHLNCGDKVRLNRDPRHLGTVQCIIGGLAKVRWCETGWISWEEPHDLTIDYTAC